MDMFRMPHGQSFGYLSTQAALTDWLVRHQGVERSDVNSRVRLAATLAQSGWRVERRWGWVSLDRRLRSALLARWSPDQVTRADWFGAERVPGNRTRWRNEDREIRWPLLGAQGRGELRTEILRKVLAEEGWIYQRR